MRVGDGVGAIVSTVVARMGGGMVSLGYTSRRMQLFVNSDALLFKGVLGALDKAQDRRLRPLEADAIVCKLRGVLSQKSWVHWTRHRIVVYVPGLSGSLS